MTFDSGGRRLAAGGGILGALVAPGEAVVRVWNLDTREVRVLDAGDGKGIGKVAFMPDGRLLSSGPGGVRVWDLTNETSTTLIESGAADALPSPDGRHFLVFRAGLRPGGAVGTAFVHDIQEKQSWDLTSHAAEITSIAWHPSGKYVVTGSRDGTIRLGELSGEEPLIC